MKTKTSSKTAAQDYRLQHLRDRQKREGYEFGFLRHEIHNTKVGAARAERVIAWLKARGFDAADAYHALNSRNARHMGDWLMDEGIDNAEVDSRIERSLWKTPAAMYECFGETKAQLEKGAR